MVSHHPAKFGGHRHSASGDIMFLVVERHDSTCSRLNHYCLSLKHMVFRRHRYDISGRTHNN